MSTPQQPANLPQPGREISQFESIRHRDDLGREYWRARELMTLLGYKKWQFFYNRAVQAAIAICANEGEGAVESNFIFTGISKNKIGDETRGRKGDDIILTRHACYLIAESADGRKDEVAWAKIYFAFATERYELLAQSEEERRRIDTRQKLAMHNAEIALRAKIAGAQKPEHFQYVFNAGLTGMYEGETAAKIRKRRGLRPGEDIYSWMGSLETASNDMRETLALHHIDTRGITTLTDIARTHHEAGKSVRQFLASEGIKPEDLPKPAKSYDQLLREQAMREMLAEQDRMGLWAQLEEDDENEEEDE